MCWSCYEYCSGFRLKQKLRGLHCISGLSILYTLSCSHLLSGKTIQMSETRPFAEHRWVHKLKLSGGEEMWGKATCLVKLSRAGATVRHDGTSQASTSGRGRTLKQILPTSKLARGRLQNWLTSFDSISFYFQQRASQGPVKTDRIPVDSPNIEKQHITNSETSVGNLYLRTWCSNNVTASRAVFRKRTWNLFGHLGGSHLPGWKDHSQGQSHWTA